MPNFLDNASKVNESMVIIDKRITTLEASNIHDNQNSRIGKLEEPMETLSSTFSSLKFKKAKAFVGGSKDLCMFLRYPNPNLNMC